MIHGFDTHYKELLEAQEASRATLSSVRTGIFGAGMSSSMPDRAAERASAFGHSCPATA